MDWNTVSKQPLTEEFIREHKNVLHWGYLCIYQTLSESFMEEMHTHLFWQPVSHKQKVSKEFVLKWIRRIDLKRLENNEKTSFTEEEWNEIRNKKIMDDIYNKEVSWHLI